MQILYPGIHPWFPLKSKEMDVGMGLSASVVIAWIILFVVYIFLSVVDDLTRAVSQQE